MPELKRFFTPPVFQDDEEKTRTASVLNTILLSVTVVLVLAGFAALFVFEQKLGSLLVVVVLLAPLLVARYLMQRHRIQFASLLLMSGMWVGVTLLVSLAGGMTSIDAAYYIMLTVIAGLLLGTRAAVGVAVMCSLAGLVMAIVDGIGYPLPRVFPVPARAGWLNLTFGLFLATIALNITLRSLHDALALARQQLEERKKAEEALQESEQRFRTLAGASFEGIALTEKGAIVDLNDQLARMLGYDRGELIGKPVTEAVSPESRDLVAESIRSGRLEPYEHLALRKDGMVFPVEVRARIAQIAGRQLRVTAIRDVTERKQAEKVLRESEERHRSLFENSPISLWEEDFSLVKEYIDDLRATGVTDFRAFFENRPEAVAHCAGLVKVLDVNKATVALVGAGDKDELLAGLSKILADEALVVFREELITLAEGGQWFESEEVHRTLSGEERFIVLNLSVAPGYANSLGKVLVSALDITERKQAEQALRESEEKYSAVVQQAKDGVIIIQDTIFQFVNKAMADILGYALGEIENTPFINYVAPESRTMVATRVKAWLAGETVPTIHEAKLLRKDGTIIDAELSAGIIQCRGKPATVGIIRDITERKQMEEALRNSEARLQTIVSNVPVILFGLDRDGIFTFSEGKGLATLGLKPGEVVGRSAFEVYQAFPDIVQILRQAMAGETLWVIHDIGDLIFDVYYTPLKDKQGRVSSVIGVATDITQRRRAEEALRESEERYRLLAEAAHDMIYIINREGNVDYANSFATQQFGRLPGEIIGRPHAELFLSDDAERQQANLRQVLEAGQPLYVENLTQFPNRRIWLGTWLVPIKDEAGQVKSILGVSRDITKRKQAEEEIQRLNAELEQRVVERTAQLEAANKELEAFSYSVSHDLRAPLRAVDGFSRILVEDYAPQLPPDAARHLKTIRENSQQMGHLIDDLLAFSRLSRQALNKQAVTTADLVHQVLADLRAEQEGRHVEISMGDLPPCQADSGLLRQVWMNLLSNALKYTRKCEVARIEIGWQEQDGESVYFVRDNGTGFDMQYAGKLFGVFQRLHRSEEYEGTGVGLAIVQRIIHRHGGRVWAEAEPDRGATFYFTI
jgi:PAS domain S-box-containing protein